MSRVVASALDRPENKADHYGLKYTEFNVPLVKAVHELSQENNDPKEKLAMQESYRFNGKNSKN
jgi:hypothetical protein